VKTVFLWLLLALSLLPDAQATSVRRMTLTEIRDLSESVVLGAVVGSETRLGANGKMVWTDYRVDVQKTLLGRDRGTAITVSIAGGRYGNIDIGVAGAPELEIGETYVLFLQQDRPYAVPMVGWGQGLFRVREASVAGKSRTVLISQDGEPLEIQDGKLRRGPQAEVRQGKLVQLSNAERSLRQAEPVGRNADGTAAPAAPPAEIAKAAPAARPATLDELQSFLSRKLPEAGR
jgi:hypothetical protein